MVLKELKVTALQRVLRALSGKKNMENFVWIEEDGLLLLKAMFEMSGQSPFILDANE